MNNKQASIPGSYLRRACHVSPSTVGLFRFIQRLKCSFAYSCFHARGLDAGASTVQLTYYLE